MYSQIKPIFLIGLFLAFFTSVSANNKPHIINVYRNIYDAANKNWSIAQDKQGIFYFGNDAGLLEFDGIEWRLNSLPNGQTAKSVAVLSHHTIFTGSYEDFGRWDRDLSGKLVYTSLSKELDPKVLRNNDFWRIWIAKDVVYFQSFSSIFVYDYKKVKKLSEEGAFLLLSKVNDDFYIQRMQGELCRLEGEAIIPIKGSDFLIGTDVRVILPYSSDKCLIGTTSKGFYIYDGEHFKEWNPSLSSFMNSKDLNCGVLTSRGTYLFGTIVDGLYEVDNKGKIFSHISIQNGLQNNTVLSLFEDNFNNVWAGLDKGITCVQYSDNLNYFTASNGPMGAVYSAILWENKLFIGTNQGVFYINKESLSLFDVLNNFKLVNGTQGQVWSFSVIDGRLFCCHNKGFKEIDKSLRVTDVYGMTGVFNLTQSNINGRDVLLSATYTNLTIIDTKTNETYQLNDIAEPIIKAEVDHLKNIWLEHENRGVYRVRIGDKMNTFTQKSYYGGNSGDGLPYKMKMFKVGGRIILYGDDEFYTYDDISDKVVSNIQLNECFKDIKNIKKITPIKDDIFWALTTTSAYKFQYDGYNVSVLERNDLGMNLSLVDGYENITVLNDSLSLICLDNGFSIYSDSKTVKDNFLKRYNTPYLKSLEISNISGGLIYKDISEIIQVPYSYNTLKFRFSTNNSFASNLSFQYKLVPVDKDWSTPQKINQVSYARLPIGEYTFLVRAVDDMGYSSCKIEILSPWYRTIWAYIFYCFTFAGLVYVIWLLLLRRYKNKHLQIIRNRETKRLKDLTNELQSEVEQKNAELLTQTSFIIQKNELIFKIKEVIEVFYDKNKTQAIAPLYQKINALLNNNLDTEDDWKTFMFSFEQKYAGFFKKMKSQYPELTNSDLKLCACLKLNLDTKDIASLMNLSVRAVENNRYRLRKKLNLESYQKLNDYFLDF